MMSRRKAYAVAVIVAFVSPLCFGGGPTEQVIPCPPALAANSVQLVNVPAGWTPSTPYAFKLSGAEIMGGPPASKAQLVPDGGHKIKNGSVTSWDLAGEMPEGKWLNCTYGEDMVHLSRRLADNIQSCSVTYTKTSKGHKDVIVNCKSVP